MTRSRPRNRAPSVLFPFSRSPYPSSHPPILPSHPVLSPSPSHPQSSHALCCPFPFPRPPTLEPRPPPPPSRSYPHWHARPLASLDHLSVRNGPGRLSSCTTVQSTLGLVFACPSCTRGTASQSAPRGLGLMFFLLPVPPGHLLASPLVEFQTRGPLCSSIPVDLLISLLSRRFRYFLRPRSLLSTSLRPATCDLFARLISTTTSYLQLPFIQRGRPSASVCVPHKALSSTRLLPWPRTTDALGLQTRSRPGKADYSLISPSSICLAELCFHL
ncbi:hypothetical protein BGZ61DRAFT_129079 [Ilyonectria robusta]|uniref:uncharacterized protein n=1 Tax=Ilyonectria robusta TaxID=1079257 RepID=UPI001E8C9FBA|nr:uncharacterized protein BGZ61DRAFT_129079 [Ilyonectria robusta]KAH8734745.1 hypothetical protein BGZ61DRAFT_129079 [Ilyonectria robusta]